MICAIKDDGGLCTCDIKIHTSNLLRLFDVVRNDVRYSVMQFATDWYYDYNVYVFYNGYEVRAIIETNNGIFKNTKPMLTQDEKMCLLAIYYTN